MPETVPPAASAASASAALGGAEAPAKKKRVAARALLRAVHRDAGYLAVGLTLVYALSGLAVNHIAAWDPNFHNTEEHHELGPLAGTDEVIAARVESELGIHETPRDIYRASDDQLDVTFQHRSLHINPKTGGVIEEGQSPRFFLRLANWLHLNRGKKAWTFVADAYAAGLLFLALSGMFMIKGPKGLIGRGAVLVLVGMAIPTLYVVLSGGP